jgi:hypothetical protein
MRYASHYAANLPIGSGATEGTCWQMQGRVKRPGQSWGSVLEPDKPARTPGLNGVMTTRGLVLSDRWDAAWPAYAAKHRSTERICRLRHDQDRIRLATRPFNLR